MGFSVFFVILSIVEKFYFVGFCLSFPIEQSRKFYNDRWNNWCAFCMEKWELQAQSGCVQLERNCLFTLHCLGYIMYCSTNKKVSGISLAKFDYKTTNLQKKFHLAGFRHVARYWYFKQSLKSPYLYPVSIMFTGVGRGWKRFFANMWQNIDFCEKMA